MMLNFRAFPATIALIAINVILFLALPLVGGGPAIYSAGVLSLGNAVVAGNWYVLVTSMFLHGSVIHILCNMMSLWYLGSDLEPTIGTGKFLIVYFLSGLAGSCVVLAYDMLTGSLVGTVGASGAIFGLFGAIGMLMIHAYRKASSTGDRQAVQASLRSYLSVLAVNVLISLSPGISWQGHIGGFIAGIAVMSIMLAVRKNKPSRH